MPRVFQKYKEEYKEEAKKRIIDAALEAMRKKGYQSMTLDDIANEVGVTKGTLYLYFKNKEELFKCVSTEMAKIAKEMLEYALVDSDNLDAILGSLICQDIEHSKKYGIENNIAMLSEWISISVRDPATGSMFVEMFQRNMQTFEESLRALQEKKMIPENSDMHAAMLGIVSLTSVVKLRIFLGDDEDEIKKWWINSAKKLLDVPVTE